MTAAAPDAIPVFKPLIEAEEIEAITRSLEDGWLGMGRSVGEFEARLHEFLELGDRHVVAVSTGHAALHLALLLCEARAGDEVVTPSFNNVTDFQAILATGARPVLCDVDDASLCIDVAKAGELVTPQTRALIVTDYATCLCDHDAVSQLAERHGLRIVHDAAHSFGSRYRETRVGAFSDITIFSFDPVKTITSIDGGAIVVRTEEEADALREMRLVGMGQPASVMYQNRRAWTYDVRRLGFRYHLANAHAAVGLAQLAKMDRITATRRATARALNEKLGAATEVRVPPTTFDEVVPFLYYIRVESDVRADLRTHLHARGIDTGIHWQPGHFFSLLSDCRRGELSVTDRVASEIVTLPFHSCMSEAEVDRVVAGVLGFFTA